ncbi:hypothetical protein EVAR_76435_1 [Eumeta japonica]|uniref:Uncharacterized protein n=1 Tax=Eumeta variegata TaxID=151549 RepID=A0A4C1TAW6_EUMVA|nr:hypothetical protein EVAR_76435_1 [Eumeta japonica]
MSHKAQISSCKSFDGGKFLGDFHDVPDRIRPLAIHSNTFGTALYRRQQKMRPSYVNCRGDYANFEVRSTVDCRSSGAPIEFE